jgi:hypothetical protein
LPHNACLHILLIFISPQKAFNLSDDALAQLVAVKDEVSVGRVAETHTLVYIVNGQPLFFEPTGRGDLFPTGSSL